MKPAAFAYWDPDELEPVLAFLGDHADESSVLAGGQSLVPLLNMRLVRPDFVIDINRVASLAEVGVEDGAVRLGALCRHDALLRSQPISDRCPLLARALPHIGHAAIRYRGTLGGSLAHGDPAAELPAVATALDAQIRLRSSGGERTIRAGEFFITHLTTAIEPGEVLTEVTFPGRGSEPTGAAVLEFTRRHGDFALVGIAAQVTLVGETIGEARLSAFGVDQVPRRLDEVEALLAGEAPTEELLRDAGAAAREAVQPTSDMHASAAYRRDMCAVLTERALAASLDDTGVEWR
ncbi:MAG: FAD binding domain-containing protein [Solirubrobacteraceae bacterium]